MTFNTNLKVRFGDIDHAGIVYYPRFLHYFHVALEEFFAAEVGIPYHQVIDRRRIGFPTVRLEIDFRRPLRFGDEISVEVRSVELGVTSITWTYAVRTERHHLAAEATHVTVCLDMDTFEKRQIPGWLRESLTAYQTRVEEESGRPG